ncbi:MAG: hypothetical protein ABJA78_02020 [Ferruginibacter sp.]
MTTTANKYFNLSVKDLLDAREAFHIHLMRKKNVVGTAIGRFRRRIKKGNGPKRLDNTVVNESSWPCILVFVNRWMTIEDFKSASKFDNYISSFVDLEDGREIPVCVVEAPPADASQDMVNEEEVIFPSDYVGGGYPLIIELQGVQRIASIGCVVSDGNKYYALTNRHVSGTPGTVVYTKVKGTLVPIGICSSKNIGNVFFRKLYTGWESSVMVSNMDVGLIEINDIKYWKTEIYRIGAIGKVFDLNTNNISLDMIGANVKAFGAVSGMMTGQIDAFFYRYKSVGGLEYVSDFLIGGIKNKTLNTKNGDSGTVWVIEKADDTGNIINQPFALQWGQHCFVSQGSSFKHSYALSTCLSNILRELEVDVVSGWNDSSDYTWGEVGHYTIANFATSMVTNAQLKTLLSNNLELITFRPDDLITDAAIKRKRKTINYTALADVPDLIWKIRGGDYQRFLENPNHFADMDKPDSQNKTLLQLCTGTGKNMKFLTPEEWLTYYTDKAVKDSSKGILPFRVWQIFIAMVDYVSKGNIAGYIASAGVLAHYIGDACQPLHISYMFNGIPGAGRGDDKKGEGVHEAFEATMINKYNKDIIPAVQTLIKKASYKTLIKIKSGKESAASTVDLMKKTFRTVKPQDIVAAFVKYGSDFPDKYWAAKGKTIVPGLFASGGHTLASLWNSAWVLGDGSNKIKKLSGIDPEEIVALYQDPQFLPSVNIHTIKDHLD